MMGIDRHTGRAPGAGNETEGPDKETTSVRIEAPLPGTELKGAYLEDLLRRISFEDRKAFAALYEATAGTLYGGILRIVKRRDAADDILQDVYIRIWEKIDTYDPTRGAPMSWMRAVARNRSLDELRRTSHASMDEDSRGEVANLASTDMLPLASLENAEQLTRLFKCLEKLDGERREIVLLAYRDGYCREELGRRFAQPVGTIKTWLRRSLIQLKACLDQ